MKKKAAKPRVTKASAKRVPKVSKKKGKLPKEEKKKGEPEEEEDEEELDEEGKKKKKKDVIEELFGEEEEDAKKKRKRKDEFDELYDQSTGSGEDIYATEEFERYDDGVPD